MKSITLSHIRSRFPGISLGFATLILGSAAGCGGSSASSGTASLAEYAYVTTFDATYQFSVSKNGQLTPLSPPTVATPSSAGIVVSSDNKFAYITNENHSSISQFSVGPNGALISLGADVTCGSRPESIVITPDNKFVFVANDLADTVSEYSVATDGHLTPLTTPTIATPHDPFQLGISPDGKYVYVACYTSNKLAGYAVGPDGQLAALPTPTYSIGTPYAAVFSPDGTHLIVPGGGTFVTSYTVQVDGSLSAPSTIFTAAIQPIGFCFTPDGAFAYASCYNGGNPGAAISQYAFANGSLQALTPSYVPGVVGSYTNGVDPSGKFLFVNNVTTGSVSQFSIGPNGMVTPNGSVTAPQPFHIGFAKK